jgi:hypothetical protein
MKQEKYKIELTEEQVAILKAGIDYFMAIEDLYFALSNFATGSDEFIEGAYFAEASSLQLILHATCTIEPNFGHWGDIRKLQEILDKYIRSEKRKIRAEIRRQRAMERE